MADKPKHLQFWDKLFLKALPKTHLLAAGGVALVMVLILSFVPTRDVSAYRPSEVMDIKLPVDNIVANTVKSELEALVARHAGDGGAVQDATTNDATRVSAEPEYQWREQRVRSGDNLSTLFQRMSLSQGDVYRVANAVTEADALKRLRPGETIAIATDEEGRLAVVEYRRSALESIRYSRSDDGFRGERMLRETQAMPAFRHVTINHSLFLDGARAGLEHDLIMRIATIFGWDIDFALDIRKGDSFAVLYEERYLDGDKVGNGAILAAEFTNRGERFRAVRYTDSSGKADYYTPEGLPMRKAFLRAPLDFTRVSSNFNPNRLHPIHKTKRPHRGVDYAAPTGTPIYAAGDGRVTKAGYTRANGNYIFIQHGQSYTTKYLHLNRKDVRNGQSVKQGEKIGTVGATGYATGPHLHYEFLVNGVHRNPRTVELPDADPIPEKEKARFAEQTQSIMGQLASFRATQLAQLSE